MDRLYGGSNSMDRVLSSTWRCHHLITWLILWNGHGLVWFRQQFYRTWLGLGEEHVEVKVVLCCVALRCVGSLPNLNQHWQLDSYRLRKRSSLRSKECVMFCYVPFLSLRTPVSALSFHEPNIHSFWTFSLSVLHHLSSLHAGCVDSSALTRR